MDNPRCLPASCGDCLFRLRNALGISLALHALVIALPGLGRSQFSGPESAARMSITLVREENPEVPVGFARADTLDAERVFGHARQERSPTDLRSTLEKPEKRKEAKSDEISDTDESSMFPDGADVAAYRLALGRSASRLIAAANLSGLSPGEIVFVLQRQPGQFRPELFLSPQSASLISSESLLEIMRVAVEQTPLPSAWGGRRFRLSLHLQVLPNQSAPGSG